MILNEKKCILKIKYLSEAILKNTHDPNKIEKYATSIIDIISILDANPSEITAFHINDLQESSINDVDNHYANGIYFDKAQKEQNGE